MTRFYSDRDTLASVDPFKEAELGRRIVITPMEEKESYLNARSLAAAFWTSYFTLHWLMLLDVIEFTTRRAGAAIFFLAAAILVTMMTAAHDAMEKKE